MSGSSYSPFLLSFDVSLYLRHLFSLHVNYFAFRLVLSRRADAPGVKSVSIVVVSRFVLSPENCYQGMAD